MREGLERSLDQETCSTHVMLQSGREDKLFPASSHLGDIGMQGSVNTEKRAKERGMWEGGREGKWGRKQWEEEGGWNGEGKGRAMGGGQMGALHVVSPQQMQLGLPC